MQQDESIVAAQPRPARNLAQSRSRPAAVQPEDAGHGRWMAAFALAFAAIALGHALQISNGTLHPRSILWLTVAFAACIVGVAAPRLRAIESAGETPVIGLIGLGLAAQVVQLLTAPPGIYLEVRDTAEFAPFLAGIGVTALLAGAGLSARPWLGQARFPLLLLVHVLLGVWLIRASPRPFIDVFVFQRDSSAALLQGINPYAITFPDIYGNSPFYGPGLSVNGRLTFGFPYPPLSLFLALPGHVLGDHRYAQLAALTLSGALIGYARPGRLAMAAASLFLLTPRVFFVLEQSWTEPFVVLLLAAVVFCACRIPHLMPVALGLFLVVKQYLVFVPLGLPLLLPWPLRWRDLWRTGWQAALVGVLVTAPLALWDLPAFIRDVVTLQFVQPFRADALSYVAWYAQRYGEQLPTWVAFAAVLPAVALALWRAPRAPSGFAVAVALICFAFFAFNKQAFCNYYFFVIGALCCAVAATPPAGQRRANETSAPSVL